MHVCSKIRNKYFKFFDQKVVLYGLTSIILAMKV